MQHQLAVIIVNYNVEFFLEQCLNSVLQAQKNVDCEVFVVDNNSIDGSVEMVRQKFPTVKLIANKDNRGFSKANNQAIALSNSKYVLLLNPDTVVEEDTFKKVVEFMDNHPDAGGLGVRMLDGKGKFLPESKRGLPTPQVAFYKIFGLSKLFPKSKRFSKYHLGYLSEFETHEIDVLSGAFMLMRKEALDKVGLLDEAFFMYGEDIDLSYRIQQGGYKNYYFPETRIIHYKGESTKKSSVNYVFVFYRAMIIFAQKHFSQKNARLFSFLINLAIYLRAGAAIIARFIRRITLPTFDIAFVIGGMFALTHRWQMERIEFPWEVIRWLIPSYALIWILTGVYRGVYDKPFRIINAISAIGLGLLVILIAYGLLPKEYQFSRLFIFIAAAWVLLYWVISRLYLHVALGGDFKLASNQSRKFAIVGSEDEVKRVEGLLAASGRKMESTIFLSTSDADSAWAHGVKNQLDQVVDIHKVDEVVFCAKDSSAAEIIDWMSRLDVDFKIAQPDSLYLVGSNSKDTAGDLYVLHTYKIVTKSAQRNKRTLDLVISLISLILSPIFIWFYKNKKQWLINMWQIVIAKKSFVGYHKAANPGTLPRIKSGILTPSEAYEQSQGGQLDKSHLLYARNFSILKDLVLLKQFWHRLDRTC